MRSSYVGGVGDDTKESVGECVHARLTSPLMQIRRHKVEADGIDSKQPWVYIHSIRRALTSLVPFPFERNWLRSCSCAKANTSAETLITRDDHNQTFYLKTKLDGGSF